MKQPQNGQKGRWKRTGSPQEFVFEYQKALCSVDFLCLCWKVNGEISPPIPFTVALTVSSSHDDAMCLNEQNTVLRLWDWSKAGVSSSNPLPHIIYGFGVIEQIILLTTIPLFDSKAR